MLAQPVMADSTAPAVTQLQLARGEKELVLDATLKFELPPAVEDALLKGVAVIFVAEAEVYRERWYWIDRRVASVERHMRLVFQPLTRRWRLSVGDEPIGNADQGISLAQTFDDLQDAMGAIRRISGWKIANLEEIETGVAHRVEFRFRLDASQLPRPLQIGAIGQSDWSLTAVAIRRLQMESLK